MHEVIEITSLETYPGGEIEKRQAGPLAARPSVAMLIMLSATASSEVTGSAATNVSSFFTV
jgi:hypothetical protein